MRGHNEMARIPKPFWWREGWYTDIGGKRKLLAKGRRNLPQAKAALRNLRNQREEEKTRCENKSSPNIRLKQLIDIYAKNCLMMALKAASIRSYKMSFKAAIKHFGNALAREITKKDAQKWKKEMLVNQYAGATINTRIIAVKRLYSWAIDNDIIPEPNPFAKIPKCITKLRERVMTQEEYEKIIAVCICNEFKEFLIALRFTTARPGELRIAKWHMLDWEQQLLILRDHKTLTNIVDKKPRVIYIPDNVIALLRIRKERWPDVPYLFCSPVKRQWTDNSVCARFSRLIKRAGIAPDGHGEKLVPYSNRHTILTEAVKAGVTGPQLQVLGGWTSLEMAKRYVHLKESDAVAIGKKAADAMHDKKGDTHA